MTALARAGWILGALLFATIVSSIAHVPWVGLAPKLLLLAFGLLAAVRPSLALPVLAAANPVAWFLFAQRWNAAVPWGEAIVCAALAGLSANAAIGPRSGLPSTFRMPAMLFGTIVIAAVIAALGVPALRLGPGFRDALATQIFREYFIDTRGFPALHTGMLLLEGTLLLVLAARLGSTSRASLRTIAAMSVAGATLAAVFNIEHLYSAAARADAFWSSLAHLSRTVRWNVHYADFNAAGSFFAMALLAGVGLTVTTRSAWSRGCWGLCTLTIAGALWLTASRAAYLSAIVATAGAAGMVWLLRSGHRVAAGTALAAATVAIVLVIALAAPMRGNQHSSLVAADVRLGMAGVAARMIASRPAFGIGAGEFHQRSGEFATPELIAKFPVAIHENAHNNFLQIAAELGLIGVTAFAWMVFGALWLAARNAAADRFRLIVLAAFAAFVITWLGGHPLLVPEAGYAFWLLLGVAAGTAALDVGGAREARQARERRGPRAIVALCAVAILASVPWRMRASMNAADLEHIGIGVSLWQQSPDGRRYRQAVGHCTLFVPTGGFRVSVNPQTDTPVRLEVRLDGRVADVVTLRPRTWNDLSIPARTERIAARFAPLELRVVDGDRTGIWITKVEAFR